MIDSCERCRPLLAGAVDDELSEEQWGLLERHLADCEACRELLEHEQDAVLLLEGLEPSAIRRDLRPAFMTTSLAAPVDRLSAAWLIALVTCGTIAKVVDLFIAGEHGLLWRCAVLVVVLLVFAVARENPLRFATDEELRAANARV